jgi:hypothetical protein
MNRTYPSRRDASRLRRATKRSAKREVEQRGAPHFRVSVDRSTATSGPVAYQLVVLAAVQMWINRLAAILRPAQEHSLREIQKAGDELRNILEDLEANAKLIPGRLITGDLHHWLLPAVAIAELVQAAALWPVVNSLPLPIALLAAIAIATVSCLLAILTGVCIGMLACDERDGPHELSPRHRRLAVVAAVVFGVLVGVAAVVLALARGNILLWLPLGLVVAAIEVTYGVARYENRHHRERQSLRKAETKVLQRGRRDCVVLFRVRDSAIGAGRQAVDVGRHILRDGEAAFDDHWRTVNWKAAAPVPSVPQVELPGDDHLGQRLLVPIPPELKRLIDLFSNGLAPIPGQLPPIKYEQPRDLRTLPELPA